MVQHLIFTFSLLKTFNFVSLKLNISGIAYFKDLIYYYEWKWTPLQLPKDLICLIFPLASRPENTARRYAALTLVKVAWVQESCKELFPKWRRAILPYLERNETINLCQVFILIQNMTISKGPLDQARFLVNSKYVNVHTMDYTVYGQCPYNVYIRLML